MSRKNKLDNRFPAVITGASSGIGKALACLFAKSYRARLILNGRNLEQLEETRRQVEALGGEAEIIAGDVGARGMGESLVAACVERFGSIDMLVNNAGMARPGRVTSLEVDDWRRVFDVNLFAAVEATYAALPHFTGQHFGKIVNISSVAGKVPFAGSVCYSSSKFAMTAMSEGMAAELAGSGVDILTVCPGWVRTEFFEKNQITEAKNPTLIARKATPDGWLMRHILSISAEQTAAEIDKYLGKGGSHEIVLTAPGKVIERLQAVFPQLVWQLNKRLPIEYVDSKREETAVADPQT